MSEYDKPIAGHRKFCRVKSCSSAGPAANSPPREDKNLLREMKMVPLPVGASPKKAVSKYADMSKCEVWKYATPATMYVRPRYPTL